jgi:hypothetical protein
MKGIPTLRFILSGNAAMHLPVLRLIRLPLLGIGLLLAAAGCNPGSIAVPKIEPGPMSEQALAEYDANNDGFLDSKELEKCPALKGSLRSMDANGDGRLSAEEIAKRLQYYLDSGAGLIGSVSCQVLLDGRPLRDATVTFVPEKFMAAAIKPASGVSDGKGVVELKTEGYDLAGVQPGFYRVEISQKDPSGQERLPARYNKETVLGQEIGPALREDIVFRLSSR